jgi:uncharacterized protein (DUF1501 family)
MNPLNSPTLAAHLWRESLTAVTRRHFLQHCTTGLGAMWLAQQDHRLATAGTPPPTSPTAATPPRSIAHFPAKAKHVIYLHMAGSPSQLELFEHKPELTKLDQQFCPSSFLEGKRFAFIRGTPRMLGSVHPFHQEQNTGGWISNQLPHFERVMDKVCFIRSMRTDQFNHAPAQFLMHTGSPLIGSASTGAWVTYGLGTANENLPGFIVLLSGGRMVDAGKSVWSAGFLPGIYQGVQCRSDGDPVLYLANPPGIDAELRGSVVAAIEEINRQTHAQFGDPETLARTAQYELAFRMQTSATDAFDLKQEPPAQQQAYGAEPGRESFANNCLLARRLVERGVRFVQLYDWGWDSHGSAESEDLRFGFVKKCQSIDRPIAALLTDLEARGLLDETLVVWGGEFGRTPMAENRGGVDRRVYGRDHNPQAFTLWIAGAGVKRGFSLGQTDEFGYDVVENPVNPRDLHATLLHLLGLDHTRLTYPVPGGLQQRLTTVTKKAEVLKSILA